MDRPGMEMSLLRSAAAVLECSIMSVAWDDGSHMQKMWRAKYEQISEFIEAKTGKALRPWPEEARRKMAKFAA
jgi:hypothetical protein